MKIAILGLGYVGMTAAGCLASQGHYVIGVDPNLSKVEEVLAGRSPITEPGLTELIATARANGRLDAHTQLGEAAATAELAIVCVGTPSAPDGSHDMRYIAAATRELAELLRRHPDRRMTVAYRSTVQPGTMDDLIAPIFEEALGPGVDRVELVYNPEFLRESTAIDDFFAPPKIVIGTKDGLPSPALEVINEGIDAPTFYVKYPESEITKFVDNAFHALKTTFANEIGRVCTKLGISATDVHRIFISDTKLNVSPYYLRPGGPFGGSCLPKDVRALQHIGRAHEVRNHLIDSLIESNEAHKHFLFELVTKDVDFGARVLLLGLAFKDRSDDLRESPNVDLARMLITAGFIVSIFDPHVHPESLMGQNLGVLSNSPILRELLINDADVKSNSWDLVIDTRSIAGDFDFGSCKVVDINRLA